jgi:hypothetical protein
MTAFFLFPTHTHRVSHTRDRVMYTDSQTQTDTHTDPCTHAQAHTQVHVHPGSHTHTHTHTHTCNAAQFQLLSHHNVPCPCETQICPRCKYSEVDTDPGPLLHDGASEIFIWSGPVLRGISCYSYSPRHRSFELRVVIFFNLCVSLRMWGMIEMAALAALG